MQSIPYHLLALFPRTLPTLPASPMVLVAVEALINGLVSADECLRKSRLGRCIISLMIGIRVIKWTHAFLISTGAGVRAPSHCACDAKSIPLHRCTRGSCPAWIFPGIPRSEKASNDETYMVSNVLRFSSTFALTRFEASTSWACRGILWSPMPSLSDDGKELNGSLAG